MLLRSLFVGFFVFVFSGGVYAGENSGARTILTYGCHKSDGTCYVLIDGPPVTGAPECVGNDIRWNAKEEANGKSWLSMIMLAAATGKMINFYIAGCHGPFPTFSYGTVYP
jgi:hypothetical protein